MRWMSESEDVLLGADNVDKLDIIEGNVRDHRKCCNAISLLNDDINSYIVTFAYLYYIMTPK